MTPPFRCLPLFYILVAPQHVRWFAWGGIAVRQAFTS